MIPDFAKGNVSDGDDPQLLADLFHDLSQPLTTLRCCLGLSLQKSPAAKQNRHDLEIAQEAAESVARLIAGIRELVEASCPAQLHGTADLDECLGRLVDDFRPVAESMRRTLSLISKASVHVAIEPRRLRQALFHLLGFALRSCQAGTMLHITSLGEDENARLTIQGNTVDQPVAVDVLLQARLALAIANRTFRTAGGSLQLQSSSGCFSLTVHLPRTLHQSLPPEASASRCCA